MSVAALAPHVSQPQDAAEIEARQVASEVVSGRSVAVRNRAAAKRIHRQDGAAAAVAGALTTFETAGGAEAEAAAGPPGWVVGAVIGLVILGAVLMASHGRGNVADTGIMDEANALIAAGQAATICAALAILLAAAQSAGDADKIRRIQTTQKAKGCRHSRNV